MPLTTSVQCPHCGNAASTTEMILPGAKLRCPRCKLIIHILPMSGGLVESFPIAGDLKAARFDALFAPIRASATLTSRTSDDCRVLTDPGERLAPKVKGPALASPKLALDGKPLPFHGSRSVVAALIIAGLALAGFAFTRWYVDQVTSLDVTAKRAGAKRAQKVEELAYSAGNPTAPKKNLAPDGPAKTPGRSAASVVDDRTTMPSTIEIGEMVVGVYEAKLGSVQDLGSDECLQLTLRITNLSTKPMTYVSLSQSNVRVTLRDQNRNYYNRFSSRTQSEQTIAPGRTIQELLFFEPPPRGVTLELDLPSENGNRPLQFRIPGLLVHRPMPGTSVRMEKAQEPPPAPPPAPSEPYEPETDSKLREDVNVVYREGIKRIEVRVRGMGSNHGVRFRKNESEKLIKNLAAKLNLSVEQIRRMLSVE
jgi:hypothetical protein